MNKFKLKSNSLGIEQNYHRLIEDRNGLGVDFTFKKLNRETKTEPLISAITQSAIQQQLSEELTESLEAEVSVQ
jgi:hypothetical protein